MKAFLPKQLPLRKALLALTVAGACALPLGFPTISMAAAPAQQLTQVPGYYRMALGDFEVTAIYDGYVKLGTNLLKDINEKDIQTLLSSMFIDSTNGVQTAVNAFLINTGTHLVLVDTGTAQCFGPTLGAVVDNIRAAGYQPEQIDTVLLTHLHPDHACGLNNQGKAAFPNATVYVSKGDADFWLSKDVASKATPEQRPMFEKSMESVAPYVANNKLKIYIAGETLLPGVKVVPTPGHTPGHSSYLFTSKGDNLLV
ncbi:MBL fold metallo-hydrolase [Yersinia aleksiciae]|uniref:Ribonuclease Z n=1 Tax=Yersinia aleksiciae TaxID=263819 RepID=A0A0T9UUS3_YERAE|nr:MBL fold metallo-hydrolase [Yersinia aleksiciae]CNL70468.1 ribonuclease Z [Yersinia aleksiciae]